MLFAFSLCPYLALFYKQLHTLIIFNLARRGNPLNTPHPCGIENGSPKTNPKGTSTNLLPPIYFYLYFHSQFQFLLSYKNTPLFLLKSHPKNSDIFLLNIFQKHTNNPSYSQTSEKRGIRSDFPRNYSVKKRLYYFSKKNHSKVYVILILMPRVF